MAENKPTQPNAAWILYRMDITTQKEGHGNLYFLLDAYSQFCFHSKAFSDLPSQKDIQEFLAQAYTTAQTWPMQFWMSKQDPLLEMIDLWEVAFPLSVMTFTERELKPWIASFIHSFKEYCFGSVPSIEEEAELEVFIPRAYEPCPCGSGKKHKFCCQPIFKDISSAMYAAEHNRLKEALKHMKKAEAKVGRTAEILCRYAIVWSYFDAHESECYLQDAQALDVNHPRTNYILGIGSVARGDYKQAIRYYQHAIEHYPPEDRYHLNEVYNNLGSVYYRLKEYQAAKDAWEKALILLPTDTMVIKNLCECIYYNKDVPEAVRSITPYVQKYLMREFSKVHHYV
jgi:tetratricopeptide (TPR) repeat protein